MSSCNYIGCRRHRRRPSLYCRGHQPDPPTGKYRNVCSIRTISAPPNHEVRNTVLQTRRAYFRNLDVTDSGNYLFVKKLVDKHLSRITREDTFSGVRTLLHFTNKELDTLNPCLHKLVDESKKRIAFPLSFVRINAPIIIVAPPVSSHSNFWSKGTIHRDMDSVDTSGVYSFLLLLGNMTKENGSVSFWPCSNGWAIDGKHPTRFTKMCPSITVVGCAGTLFVWDARILHQSLPNQTTRYRVGLHWIVNSTRSPPLTVYV